MFVSLMLGLITPVKNKQRINLQLQSNRNTHTCILHWQRRPSSFQSKLRRPRLSPPGRAGCQDTSMFHWSVLQHIWPDWRRLEAYHAVYVFLFLLGEDGDQRGLFGVAAHHSRVEVHDVGVVVVVADVVVLPPARVSAAVGSWEHKPQTCSDSRRDDLQKAIYAL